MAWEPLVGDILASMDWLWLAWIELCKMWKKEEKKEKRAAESCLLFMHPCFEGTFEVESVWRHRGENGVILKWSCLKWVMS